MISSNQLITFEESSKTKWRRLPALPSGVCCVDEEDSDDEFYRLFMLPTSVGFRKRMHSGSVKGKRADKDRERADWGERLMADYLGDSSTYDARDFRRRFRMRSVLFHSIVATLIDDEQCDYFAQKPDATGLLGFLPEQNVTCALRMLAYGASADHSIIRLFRAEYLRKPTPQDSEALLDENAARGFPGMVGSLDCTHWTWKNCPTSWAGVYKGKEKASTIILEAVATRSNNGLNALERSPLLDDLVNGDGVQVSSKVNGATNNHVYYLTDGIYPAWAISQKTITEPDNQK
ncbi:Transposon protein [Phytophthora megakarya]|uniref:Transposon protein n=1 Tax=Phytophthora megakarya TaxID=4795 RepID=A0A225W9G0_9STRA|nr:Transposon protein [Phytophthora megakarya]